MDSTPATEKRKDAQPAQGGVKDTIESILVAFILAFIFCAFVVEAFVIPTGSMAPTLLGAHMSFRCPECGYKWAENYSNRSAGDDMYTPDRAVDVQSDGQIKPRVLAIICPNCGYRLPRQSKEDPANTGTAPAVEFGDRILVLKYLYLFSDPRRWDVVVFKSPDDPATTHYQQNYIKRLIGLPGDSIMVLNGDIYVGHRGDNLTNYQIQTKPRHAQEALWRIVYDNDFQPKDAGQPRYITDPNGPNGMAMTQDPIWKQPWVEQPGGSGWVTGSPAAGDRNFHFDNGSGGSTLKFDPPGDLLCRPLTNWLAYNYTFRPLMGQTMDTYLASPYEDLTYVSDLKLMFFYQRQRGDGPLRLSLSKNDDTFIAEFTPGVVRLIKSHDGVETELSQAAWEAPSRPSQIEFSNVDYRVALRIEGKELLATTSAQYQPDIPDLLRAYDAASPAQRPTIKISAANQVATLQHLSLWRDVYYTNHAEAGSPESIFSGTPRNPAVLGNDEYFTMGDNSSNSKDARYWQYPIELPDEELNIASGRVPGRFMLGKAFFVYWPAGYRMFDKGLIPNFGDMRLIH